MKRSFGRIGLCAPLCIALLLGGCLTQANQQEDAAKMVQQMHAAMQTQQWDAALALYGDDFYGGYSREVWRAKLAAMHERFGELRKIKAGFAQKDPRFGGDFYIYGFKLFYERGVVHETLTVFMGLDRDAMKVIGHLFKYKDKVL